MSALPLSGATGFSFVACAWKAVGLVMGGCDAFVDGMVEGKVFEYGGFLGNLEAGANRFLLDIGLEDYKMVWRI